ncbi:MAG: hypothetical protein H6741_14755 [Alphaproteobacteria bacterium]|nr:hypothetical protein [Alphaproteobacteria bacterium]MCB9793978.1 hypothetical protein [Alphaproteobacteria bacterium]
MAPLIFLLMPWYVSDAQEAEALQRALDAHWTGEPVQVEQGPPPEGAEGVQVKDGSLIWTSQGREVRQAAPASPVAQVLLLKSWSMALEPVDGGWVPEPIVQAPPPAAEPPEAPPADAVEGPWEPNWMTGLTLGAGMRSTIYTPPARVGLELARHDLKVNVGATALGDLQGRTVDGEGRVHRVGTLGMVGLDLERTGGRGELWLMTGNRWLLMTHDNAVAERHLMPAVGLRARWWASPYGSFSVGGGLTLLGELVPDGGVAPLPWEPTANATHSPWSLTLELSAGRFR